MWISMHLWKLVALMGFCFLVGYLAGRRHGINATLKKLNRRWWGN